MRVLDLFSGIGGMSLGLERAGMTTVAFCELAEFQTKVLNKHWPDVPVISGIESIRSPIVCDVIAGGFPCQAHSTAARGRNIKEKDLWHEMERVIALCSPKFVLGENVSEQAVTYAGGRLSDLGYNITIRRISGSDCGAWHQRNRWWLIAHPYDQGKFLSTLNAKMALLPEVCRRLWTAETYSEAIRVSDGIRSGLDEARLVSLGNSVIPQIPEMIGRAIMAASNHKETE